MNKLITCTICAFSLWNTVSSQTWLQTTNTPQGSGVTQMIYRKSTENLFVTTGSYNYPSGEMGGIRRSSDDGETWQNLVDCYIARNIIEGPDSNLYASYWPYPQNEGLYRSTDNGDTWQQLVSVPTGNNIFSIAVDAYDNQVPNIIYAGTRTGVYRSLDNGSNWAYANVGIPNNSWVYDIAVDSNGVVAAGTSTGLYISHDLGDSWQPTAGIPAGYEVSSLFFEYPLSGKGEKKLIIGNHNGDVLVSNEFSLYLLAAIVFTFAPNSEAANFSEYILQAENVRLHGVLTFPTQPTGQGGLSVSENGLENLQLINDGLPANPKTSGQTGYLLPFKESTKVALFVGLFEGTNGGARIYKTTYTASVGINDYTGNSEGLLVFTRPNPGNTKITFEYSTTESYAVVLEIFDPIGHKIWSQIESSVVPGTNEINWYCSGIAPSVYYYTIKQGNKIRNGKILLN